MLNPNLPFNSGPRNLLGFRIVQTLPHNLPLEELFVGYLFINSAKRRVNAGHDGLLLEAANDLIDFNEDRLERIWEADGYNLSLAKDWRNDLAENIVSEFRDNFSVKDIVKEWLRSQQLEIINDTSLTRGDPNIAVYVPDVPNSLRESIVALKGERYAKQALREEPIRSFHRALDYIEHLKGTVEYKPLFLLKCALTTFVRVHNCFHRL